ncbi:Hypothetical protein DIP0138 [Corynebacterium diphtheriae]|uniref:Uncharacterized protein n=1 Tax=Corynebacterium diphtheriae (strain ATCC 700971 / NCTC 13129 / Biotype gravis) TaxID=257309 RepID=Q6NK96_CORDI|nr:Hypothetical protein DIP0138 [Corynebacterium diphtheriae]
MDSEKETQENDEQGRFHLPPAISLEREDVVKFNQAPDRPRS